MRLIAPIGSAILLTASTAVAAQLELQQLEVTLRNCARLRNESERLTCYDRIVRQLDAGSTDARTVDVAPETLFGIPRQADGPTTANEPQREELASITSRVRALGQSKDGSLRIELENGQVWRQLDERPLRLKVGDTVTISRGAFDSFRIAAPDNRFGRVRRMQ